MFWLMEHKDNLFTYLKWRGDLTIQQDPLNEIDGLMFSELSYLRLDRIVPAVGEEGMISIKEANRLYKKTNQKLMYYAQKEAMFDAMAESKRYGEMTLCHYVSTTDTKTQQQFAAMHINVAPGQTFIVFRGTDSTVVGWREDCNMSYMMPVPAQQSAVDYVERTVKGLFKKYYLGGHSKGGNLAIYSAVFSNPKFQRKIAGVYSYDGPGFNRTMVNDAAYIAIKDRIHAFVPEESVVGLLMEHEEDYFVVQSNQMGLLQHEGLFWKISGNQFELADQLHPMSQEISDGIRSFLGKVSEEEKKVLVDSFFSVFEKAGVDDFRDLLDIDAKMAAALLKAVASVPKETRELIGKLIKLLVEEKVRK